ncbi:MAG: ATP-dependent zinc metalloprotease FtsH [bacterium]
MGPKSNISVKKYKFKINIKTLFIIFFIGLFLYFSFRSVSDEFNKTFPEKSLTQTIHDIKADKIKNIEIIDNKIVLTYKNDNMGLTFKETGQSFIKTLQDNDINLNKLNITVKDTQTSAGVASFLANLIPTILLVVFFVFLFKQARGAQDSVFSFGQAKTKQFSKDMPQITFADVAGVDEAKQALEEVVDFLKNPNKYKKLGARTPKGVILVGPAGCGKTLLARAVAGEAKVPFFSIAGSEFMEMLVGIGAARVRNLFQTAKKASPSIIFIDEIDAIGRARAYGVMQSHDEREQTLNQILVEMDGFEPTAQVVVVAATNRGDLLDPALLRPGRFDRRVVVDYPDLKGREMIIKIHAKGKPFNKGVVWKKVAKRTVGFSGADLENMLNEAAIGAAREEKKSISEENIEESATRVKLGPEKKRIQSDMDKKLTAYHEAGHALVSYFQSNTDPVHRISIVSRGVALGFTLIPPSKDKLHETKTHLLESISVMMGGRAAEELVFKEITTGAASDFDQATQIAKAMVVEYGMSSLGPINLGPSSDITNMSKNYFQEQGSSQEILAKIDHELSRILSEGYKNAKKILTINRKALDKVAKELIKKESLDQEEFEALVSKKK